MKIVIPMAGEGSRFVQAGYALPKPLIDVGGKPMIQRVVENLSFEADFIFVVRQEHLDNHSMESNLRTITNGRCEVVPVERLTEGAACTVLLTKSFIDCEEELLISNSDDLIEFDRDGFQRIRNEPSVDGIIFTFEASDPKWSFARCDGTGRVVEVAEKRPISNRATCGKYYFRRGSDFVAGAERMLEKNIRTNGEFYVCPVYNELIEDGKVIVPFDVYEMGGLGTPEDLDAYLNRT